MNDRSVPERLADARDHAAHANQIASTMDFDIFTEVTYYQHAVRSHLIIVGQALNAVPKTVRLMEPMVPWGKVIGTRNRLVHAYWLADLAIIYDAARHETPDLVERLNRLIERLG